MAQQQDPKSRRPKTARGRLFARREFLRATVLHVAGLELACNARGRIASEGDAGKGDGGLALPAERYFPQSVASFDPRPNSVVVWTRVVDDAAGSVLPVQLEMALDAAFEHRLRFGADLAARAASDHCVRARIEGLDPGTVYYYRFVYEAKAGLARSRVGRTKTAPAPGSDATVRFAVTSCQDFSGHYHAYRWIADMELDFVVHLGDYIYETANDPAFQDPSAARSIAFDDVEGALRFVSSDPSGESSETSEVLAARSLDNYRQLYRSYRSDPDLQRLHERFPMIAVWDDHEFSNDSYGSFATYGEMDAEDAERRANADQAWTEYMSIDFPAGPDFEFDREAPFPDNLRIHRDFEFGRHLLLMMTDLRRYRPAHLIPGDAFPPAIVLDGQALLDLLGEVPERAVAYVNVDDSELHDELVRGADSGVIEATPEQLTGPLDAAFVNESLDAMGSTLARVDTTSAPRGIPYSALGKTTSSGTFGSRYFVDYEVFSWLARARYAQSGGASENLMGDAQETWFVERLRNSSHTFKVWGNEFGLMERRVDLRAFPVPDELRREVLVSADDWDGAPNRRSAILQRLTDVENLVVVTGDLHSFFAGTTGTPFGDRVIEFMCGAASSSTYRAIIEQSGLTLEGLGDIGVAASLLLQDANRHIGYLDLSSNGLATVVVNGEQLELSFHRIAYTKVREKELAGELSDHFVRERFRVRTGTSRLEREIDGEFRRWDPGEGRWVLG